MHTQVPLQLVREFDVRASPADTHALLADVPRSAAHFPGVERLLPLGDNAFRWEMRRTGIGELSLQTVYASRYRADPVTLRVEWEPLPGTGNAEIAGHWDIGPRGSGAHVRLVLDARFSLPLPHLLAGPAARLLAHELGHQVDLYIASLVRTLGAPH